MTIGCSNTPVVELRVSQGGGPETTIGRRGYHWQAQVSCSPEYACHHEEAAGHVNPQPWKNIIAPTMYSLGILAPGDKWKFASYIYLWGRTGADCKLEIVIWRQTCPTPVTEVICKTGQEIIDGGECYIQQQAELHGMAFGCPSPSAPCSAPIYVFSCDRCFYDAEYGCAIKNIDLPGGKLLCEIELPYMPFAAWADIRWQTPMVQDFIVPECT